MKTVQSILKKSYRKNKYWEAFFYYLQQASRYNLPKISSFEYILSYGKIYKKYHPMIPLQKGTKSPIFGNEAASWVEYDNNAPTNAGYTLVINGTLDDNNIVCNLPFTYYLNKTGYTNVYVSTNTYITFGTSSTAYRFLSASNPPYPKFLLGAGDCSVQRAWTKSESDYFRVRVEGTRGPTGTGGNPNIVYEVTFCNPELYNGNMVFELLVGIQARAPDGVFLIANSNQSLILNTPTFVQYQSYVFIGNPNGEYWSIYKGYSLENPPY